MGETRKQVQRTTISRKHAGNVSATASRPKRTRRAVAIKLSDLALDLPETTSHNAQLPETDSELNRDARRRQRRQAIRAVLTRRGKYNFSSIACLVLIVVSLVSLVFAFFSDLLNQSLSARSGYLCAEATLKIDGQIGDKMPSVKCPYVAVEYLQFDGKSWIDTGVDQTGNIAVNINFKYDITTPSSYAVFGSRSATDSGANGLYIANSSGGLALVGVYNNVVTQLLPNVDTQQHAVSFSNATGWVYDGVAKGAAPAATVGASANNLFIGTLNQVGKAYLPGFTGKVYSVKIDKDGTDNDRNFAPAYDPQTDQCGLYDHVSGNFLTNAGTGNLTCPKPAAETASSLDYTPLDYVQFTGSQFFDTGIDQTGNLGVSVDFALGDTDNGSPIMFGSGVGGEGSPQSFGLDATGGYLWPFWGYSNYHSATGGNDDIEFNDNGGRHQISYDYTGNLYVDGSPTLYGTLTGLTLPTQGRPIYLGAYNNDNNGATNFYNGKIYSFSLTRDGQTVLNLTPVKENATGKCGFLDSVSGQFMPGDDGLGCGNVAANSASANSPCGGLFCRGENQGATGVTVQANTIHEFSYTLKNTGTVDWQNYTGDRISAWLDNVTIESGIPDTYTPAEYVQFTSTQFIDTGVNYNGNLNITADYQFDNTAANFIFGGRPSVQNGGIYATSAANGALSGLYNARTVVLQNTVNTGRYIVNFNTAVGWTWNGGFIANSKPPTSGTGIFIPDNNSPTYNIYLGALNNGGTAATATVMNGKIYSLQIDKDGTANDRDFVPAVRSSDGVCGLWDKVTQTFFTAKSTASGNASVNLTCGASTSGGEVLPDQDNPLRILLFPGGTSDDDIQADIASLQSGGSAAHAIANLDGSCLDSDIFYGTDDGIPACSTGVLSGTLNDPYIVNQTKVYKYKFVVYAPPSAMASGITAQINFGLSSGAQGTVATNWTMQLHPYVNAKTPIGNPPTVTSVKSAQPFIDQIVSNDVTVNPASNPSNSIRLADFSANLVTANDSKDGTCVFGAASGCTIALTDDGGFDPDKVGTYDLTYKITDSDGNSVSQTASVTVWNFVKISNGEYTGIALGSNGSVWTWGDNDVGQRGLGNTTGAASLRAPTQISQSAFGNLPVIDIAGSYDAACAINSAGKLYCWGRGGYGALGNGGTSNSSSPVAATMPSNGVTFTQINGSQGDQSNSEFVALGSDGNAYTWGLGNYHRLGTASNSVSYLTVPTQISTTGDMVQVSQGAAGGAAVSKTGGVYVWGSNNYGQLALAPPQYGDTFLQVNAPPHLLDMNAMFGGKQAKQVSEGGDGDEAFVLAVMTDGTVYGWGLNTYGRLGLGSSNTSSPLTAPTLSPTLSGITQVSASTDYSLFVAGNDLWSVGYQNYGEGFQGATTTASAQSPKLVTMANIAGNVAMVANGPQNSWILSKDGKTVWGIGNCTSANQNFGSTTTCANTQTPAVPWSFAPAPL